MKVKELISKLQKEADPEAIILSATDNSKEAITIEVVGFFEEIWTKNKLEYVLDRGRDKCIKGVKLFTQ